jgi:hypothetical protein
MQVRNQNQQRNCSLRRPTLMRLCIWKQVQMFLFLNVFIMCPLKIITSCYYDHLVVSNATYAERSMARVCGLSLARIAGSNTAGCMDICCEYCMSGRRLCDGPISRPEEFYRLWCVIMGYLETRIRRP